MVSHTTDEKFRREIYESDKEYGLVGLTGSRWFYQVHIPLSNAVSSTHCL